MGNAFSAEGHDGVFCLGTRKKESPPVDDQSTAKVAAGGVHADNLNGSLTPGKHLEVRLSITGTVKGPSVRAVSRRLVFFQLHVDDGTTHECLAKGRDRCLMDGDIQLLASTLAARPSTCVHIAGFPEVAEEGDRSVHVIQATIFQEDAKIRIPDEWREPEEPVQLDIVRYKTSGNHARPNNAYRHRHLVQWLLETFGRARLSNGAGVLDVAGGAGGVAFELSFRHGVPCTVVDPRMMKLNSKQRRALKNRANAQTVLAAAPPPPGSPVWLSSLQSAGDEGGPPQAHAAAGVAAPAAPVEHAAAPASEGALIDASVECGTCEEQPDPDTCEVPSSYALAWAAEGILSPPPRQICGYFDMGFAGGVHAELWHSCEIIVGMHPDQATEPIVRLALAAGKPFAVVPCCVFYKSNPNRKLRDGTPVETHEQFCDYLVEVGDEYEGARVGRAQLNDFEGRNTVVYNLGDRSRADRSHAAAAAGGA